MLCPKASPSLVLLFFIEKCKPIVIAFSTRSLNYLLNLSKRTTEAYIHKDLKQQNVYGLPGNKVYRLSIEIDDDPIMLFYMFDNYYIFAGRVESCFLLRNAGNGNDNGGVNNETIKKHS